MSFWREAVNSLLVLSLLGISYSQFPLNGMEDMFDVKKKKEDFFCIREVHLKEVTRIIGSNEYKKS